MLRCSTMQEHSLPFELRELQKAQQYQRWMIAAVTPYLGKRILELGAGIGNMSQWLLQEAERLVVTESDARLLAILREQLPSSSVVSIQPLDLTQHTIQNFAHENIDTIISFNVLEHIEDDYQVMRNCAALLHHSTATTKRIITLVPAHQWAYGKMDKAVGHYRRYTRARFRELHQAVMPEAKLTLLPFNFVGLWGWWFNGRLLGRECAGGRMINFVNACCPLFQMIDRLVIKTCRIPLGQSLIAVQEWT